MGQTPKLSLPYPEIDDSADVPRDVKALADALDGIVASKNLVYDTAGVNGPLVPVSAPDGTLALLWIDGLPVLARFQTDAWYCFSSGAEMFSSGVPGVVAAGTGWRLAALPNLTVPLRGVYEIQCMADVAYNVVENVGGVGVAAQNVGVTAAPTLIGTAGAQPFQRTNVWSEKRRVTVTAPGTDDRFSLRVNTTANASVTFYRAAIYAEPHMVYGTA
jgi:hypothetical protein